MIDFNPITAAKVGLNAAVLLHHSQSQINYQRQHEMGIVLDRVWCEFSLESVIHAYPFLTPFTVDQAFKKLHHHGFLIVTDYKDENGHLNYLITKPIKTGFGDDASNDDYSPMDFSMNEEGGE